MEHRPTKQTERVHTATQEVQAFSSSVQESMDKVYGKQFAQASDNQQHEVVAQALNDHINSYSNQTFANPFEKEKEAEKLVLNLSPDEDDRKIETLLGLVHDVGIIGTIKAIEKTESHHIKDDLHRVLVQYLKSDYEATPLPEKAPEAHGLGMTLFELYLPTKEDKQEAKQELKILLSSMEQFYAGMLSVTETDGKGKKTKSHFTLEIALPQERNEVLFYCAVPDDKIGIFKNQLLAIFPDIKLVESNDDYNIFNRHEFIATSTAELKKSELLPTRLYEEYDYDPLNILLEAFSGLEQKEGAAVQIVLSPENEDVNGEIYEAIEKIEEGVDPKEALKRKKTGLSAFVAKGVKGMFDTRSSEKKEKDEAKAKERATRTDRKEIVEELRKKAKSHPYQVNIRLVTAGNTQAHANGLLAGIESAFNQFANPNGNSFEFKRKEKQALQKAIHNFTYRIFDVKNALLLSTKELTSLLHFHKKNEGSSDILNTSSAATAGASSKTIESAVGAHGVGETTPGKILLGYNKHQDGENPIYMQEKDRFRHFYTIGQTGTGKSVLLQNMIIQDINNGEGCCFIDPHGSDIEDILANIPEHRKDDVIYFDPSDVKSPMGMNMLEFDEEYPEQKTFVINELFSIFQKLYSDTPESMGPAFEQYFRNATALVMEDPATGNTMFEISRVLSDANFRNLKLARCKNVIVKQFWEKIATQAGGEASLENIVPYITNKFDVFLANDFLRPIIAQEKSAFNFREVMDNKKILLINLSKGRLGEINANLIGMVVVGKILMSALSRVDSLGKELPPFYLYIDEFQNISTNSISQILSEARKYKLSLNIAHQFIKQLDEGIRDAVFGNVGSMCTFRVSADDAEFLEKSFTPTFGAQDIMNIENRNAYLKLLVNGEPQKPFNIVTADRFEGTDAAREEVKALSRKKYGGNLEQIEEAITKKYQFM